MREEKLSSEKINTAFKQQTKAPSFQTIFKKYEKIKKSQQKSIEEAIPENKPTNLLLQRSQISQIPQIPQQETDIKIRNRNESGSFHSTTSIDSVDRVNFHYKKSISHHSFQAIMEDLSEILFPQKPLFC